MDNPQDLLLQAWKRQLDAALGMLEAAWMQGSAEKSLAYWRSVSQAVTETDAALARCAKPLERAA